MPWTQYGRVNLLGIGLLGLILSLSPQLKAESGILTPPSQGYLLAQADYDDSYDPFADYSEFEESVDEEEDINFFRNGRLFTLGLIGGMRGFTGNMGKVYKPGGTFGLFLSYFFDLRFALQIGFLTGDHTMSYTGPTQTVTGLSNYTDISFNLKYYLNTQNVTRGLADLNPYFIAGISQIHRTNTITGLSTFGKESAMGFNGGAGVEIPFMRNKMYFGLQGMYQYVSFNDENRNLVQNDGTTVVNIKPAGDSYTAVAIIGVNF